MKIQQYTVLPLLALLTALACSAEPADDPQSVGDPPFQSTPESPEVNLTQWRTGEFEVRYTIADVLGQRSAGAVAGIIPIDKPVSWEVFVLSFLE